METYDDNALPLARHDYPQKIKLEIPEPDLIQKQDPELTLQLSIVAEIRFMLSQAGIKFLLIESFGLDIAIFLQ